MCAHDDNTDGHEQGVSYGETYVPHAGMIGEMINNIAYRPAHISDPGYMLQQELNATTPTDVVTQCDC